MTLKKYLMYVKFLIVVFPYFLIGILCQTYPTRSINREFYFYLYCLLFGAGLGLIFCGITHLCDWYPFEPLILSSDETILLNNTENIIDIDIEEKKLRDQKEIASAKKTVSIWLIASTVLYSTALILMILYPPIN
jgi:hypothetical protein